MKQIVRVIAHSIFLGVPPELLPGDTGGNVTGEQIRAIKEAGQDHGSDAERLIECAGRTCYDSYGKGRDSTAYHKHIQDVDHGSVTEHAWISFFLSGISRGLTHELVRHRVGVAISQRSTRYVDESNSEWALHPLLTKYIESPNGQPRRANNGEQVELSMEQICGHVQSTAEHAYRVVVEKIEDALVEAGTDKLTARKQARGAARGLLGNALSTEMVWSCNVRALKQILKQRANQHADAEIRLLANRLYEEALPFWGAYLDGYEKRDCPDGIGYELYLPRKL